MRRVEWFFFIGLSVTLAGAAGELISARKSRWRITLPRLAPVAFLVLVSVSFGYFIRANQIWPTPQLHQIYIYIVGDGIHATTFTQRVANDIGGRPYRNLVTS
ncbi:MAG: hypothetical protein O7G83_03105, partial [Proteobacteria bacterium]|nr:hypothetical protein [Pseudomonadota bacterium]